MRVFIAGASGVIGTRLVPLLVEAGHQVVGMTRSPHKAPLLRDLGAEPVVCDVYDAAAVHDVLARVRPDVVLDELTDLPDDAARIRELGPANSRIRREGTRNLLAGAEAAAVGRFVSQSVAWQLPGDAGAAAEEHERAVLDAGGVVVRYGQFYGPGTYYESKPPPPRIHIDEAARRTLPALDAAPGAVIVVQE